ncbi:30S ribosomal protein S5 [Candidatus Peregrinibacteria bacterium]|nr:MAG: 30S ribosomal protein S5 [Candidatus Peregrinibacteria bacterium]
MSKKQHNKSQSFQKEVKEFEELVLKINRVTRVVKGGRRLRFRVLVAIGDQKGRVGIGLGKATEVVNGIKKAVSRAKQSLIQVPITKDGSIPHYVDVKYKAARMMLMPAAPGTGVIAGGSLRKMLNLAGVKNVLSKNHGTNNKVVTAQAALRALQKLKPLMPHQEEKQSVVKEEKPAPKVEKKAEKPAKEK